MRVYHPKRKGGAPYKKWYVSFTDSKGLVRKMACFTDKAASIRFGQRIDELVACRRSGSVPVGDMAAWLLDLPLSFKKRFLKFGLLDEKSVVASQPVSELLSMFKKQLEGKGREAGYVRETIAQITKAFKASRVVYTGDIDASRVNVYLCELKAQGARNRTYNAYLTSLKNFCNWLHNSDYISKNPLTTLAKRNEKIDRKKVRRALSAREVTLLMQAASRGEKIYGLTGTQRRLVCFLAVYTGLRHKEIRTLPRSAFSFSGKHPTVHVLPKDTKNSEGATLTLHAELAEELRLYFADNPMMPNVRVFPMWRGKGAQMLRRDAELAGVAVETSDGILDFHCLRHTFSTLCVKSGMHPRGCLQVPIAMQMSTNNAGARQSGEGHVIHIQTALTKQMRCLCSQPEQNIFTRILAERFFVEASQKQPVLPCRSASNRPRQNASAYGWYL